MGRYTGKRSRPHPHEASTSTSIPAAAFTRAYEAELVRGPCPSPRLIRVGESNVWADRHDILHLLDALPSPPPAEPPSPSFSSWSLASDTEDTFPLSGDEELAAHTERKRRYWVEGLREARLREREKEDEEAERERENREQAVLNEPPTPEILKLMEHTARALASSPNPAALEMRIMTRHSTDARFAFLRSGAQSSAVWARVKAAAMVAAGKAIGGSGPGPGRAGPSSASLTTKASGGRATTGLGGLGGLGGYGSDGSERGSSDDGQRSGSARAANSIPPEPAGSPPPPPPPDSPPPPQPSPPPSPPP